MKISAKKDCSYYVFWILILNSILEPSRCTYVTSTLAITVGTSVTTSLVTSAPTTVETYDNLSVNDSSHLQEQKKSDKNKGSGTSIFKEYLGVIFAVFLLGAFTSCIVLVNVLNEKKKKKKEPGAGTLPDSKSENQAVEGVSSEDAEASVIYEEPRKQSLAARIDYTSKPGAFREIDWIETRFQSQRRAPSQETTLSSIYPSSSESSDGKVSLLTGIETRSSLNTESGVFGGSKFDFFEEEH